MVARRTADARSLAVITSYSSHSVQKSCCVMAASSSTIKTLGFILVQLLGFSVADSLQCPYRDCNKRTRAPVSQRNCEITRFSSACKSRGTLQSWPNCPQELTKRIVTCLHLWTAKEGKTKKGKGKREDEEPRSFVFPFPFSLFTF